MATNKAAAKKQAKAKEKAAANAAARAAGKENEPPTSTARPTPRQKATGGTSGGRKGQSAAAREMEKELAQLRKQLALEKEKNRKAQKDAQEEMQIIPRPKNAGRGRGGIQHAMGLDKTDDDEFLYKQIIHDLHSVVDEAFVDWSVSYKQQNPEVIGKIFTRMRRLFPVLKRYQNNWATGLLVQQYMNNHRKYANSRGYPLSMGSKSGVEELVTVGNKKRGRAISINARMTDTELEQAEESGDDSPHSEDDEADSGAGGAGQGDEDSNSEDDD